MVSSLLAGMPSSSVIDRGGRHARVADPHVGGFTSEWWAASPRNGGRLHVGTVGGFTSVPPAKVLKALGYAKWKSCGVMRYRDLEFAA
jgi:hypothetical protein